MFLTDSPHTRRISPTLGGFCDNGDPNTITGKLMETVPNSTDRLLPSKHGGSAGGGGPRCFHQRHCLGVPGLTLALLGLARNLLLLETLASLVCQSTARTATQG